MTETNALRRALESCAPRAHRFLMDMIRFPSTHGNEGEVQGFIAETWRSAGFAVERHPIPTDLKDDPEYSRPACDASFDGRENLVVRAGRGQGRSLIVNTHVDVVPAGDWAEAYEPRLDEGVVHGRGACDAKGCVATIFLAALAAAEAGLDPAGDVILQFVIDEEVGGNGSLALIREGIRADGVVVIEPTCLRLHNANRGAIWFRFDFEGKSCHMGRKHEGINAIDLACETMQILYEYEKELIADQASQPLFAAYEAPAQVNVGMLHGGHFPSVVPGRAEMEGGIGFLPNRPMAQVKTDVVRYIEERGSDALKAGYRLSFPRLHNDSYETPVEDPFVRAFHAAALSAGAPRGITGWNVSCDARLFARLGGMPTVVFGAGDIEDAHSANEKLAVSEMLTAAEALLRCVENWCGAR